MTHRYLISTDLDGTLIDHHSYSFDAALPAIKRCQELDVPIILNTSKTYAEASQLQMQLGINAPIIVENGSALFFSNSDKGKGSPAQSKIFGANRTTILNFIKTVRASHHWQFEGFNDWSITKIAEVTGLSLTDAERANTKQFSEPFVWQDSQQAFELFTEMAEQAQLTILKGGRFFHLQGQTDKAKPLQWLRKHYSDIFSESSANTQPITLIALGDNHNDIAMLNIADISVCVRSPVTDYPQLSTQLTVIQTQKLGPEGWNEAIQNILSG